MSVGAGADGGQFTGRERVLAPVAPLVAAAGWETYESVVPWLTVYGAPDVVADLGCAVVGWAPALPIRRRFVSWGSRARAT